MAERSATRSHRGHRYIQWVLRVGLALSTALVVTGLVVAVAGGERAAAPAPLRSLLSTGTLADRLVAVGLVILCLTPVLRVVALVAIWIDERDRTFTIVGLAVLAILTAAILWGHA